MDPEYPSWLPGAAGGYPEPSLGNLSTGFGGRDADAVPSSPSQVPGTSGAPSYTPSATPGGVASGSPGAPASSSPWGTLAAMLGLNAPQSAAGAMKPGQGMKIAQLGMRMLGPPASPINRGMTTQLSSTGQNPLVQQYQQMLGVDYNTALAMAQLMHSGGTAMTPGQQTQMTQGGQAFMPPTTLPSWLLPASQMPTPASPYGSAQRMPIGRPLPPLGQGAFPNPQSTNLFGMPQMADGGRPTGPTIVGEQGPEIFVPDVPGSIVPMRPVMPTPTERPAMQTLQMQTLPYYDRRARPQMQPLPYVQRNY